MKKSSKFMAWLLVIVVLFTCIPFEVHAASALTISLKSSATEVAVGDKITLSVTASGGNGNYTYSYLIHNLKTNKWSRLTSTFTKSSTYKWTAPSEGKRDFYVEVKDSTGKIVRSKAMRVNVDNQLRLTVTYSKSSVELGNSITLKATAVGGSGNYKYSYLVHNLKTGAWSRLTKQFIDKNTYKWTPSSVGKRQFFVEVKDSTGKVVRSAPIYVNATEPLQVSGKTNTSVAEIGDVATLKGTATGGSENYKYSFLVHNLDTNKWSRLTKTFTKSNEYKWTLSSVGNREVFVEVKDSTGKVVRSGPIKVKVANKLQISASSSASSVQQGKQITLKASVTGGSGGYKYSYLVHNLETDKWSRLTSAFIDSNTYKWTASSTGKREFFIEVKDSAGRKVRSSKIIVDVKEKTVGVSDIQLDTSYCTMNINTSKTLYATISPQNASNKGVAWSSSNPSVATVNTSGVVTAVGAGSAVITVKTNDGAKVATCTVNVHVPTESVSILDGNTIYMNINASKNLSAVVSPQNASNKGVTWSSSNPAVATVNEAGMVTAVGGGSTTITVKTNDGGKIASCIVNVHVPVTSVSILNGSAIEMLVNNSETLYPTVLPQDASNRSVTWSSNNSAVVSVSQAGVITANSPGTAVITVQTGDGNKTANCTVTVKSPVVTVNGVAINGNKRIALDIGGSYSCTATVSPLNATNKSVIWTSSDTNVATVDSNGNVRAIARGKANIIVKTTDGSYTDSIEVCVYKTNPAIPSSGDNGNIWYRVRSVMATNLLMDVRTGVTANGTVVHTYEQNDTDAQLWQMHDYRGVYGGLAIVPRCNSGAYILDANRVTSTTAPLKVGSPIDLWTLGEDNAASMWELIRIWDGSYIFKLINSNLVVALSSTESEKQLVLAEFDPFSHSQRWYLEAVDKGNSSGITKEQGAQWARNHIGQSIDTDGYYGAQCKDFVNKFTQDNFGITFAGNANDLIYCSLPAGWTRIKNTLDFIPQPGDIALWDGGSYGHTGIILSANINTFLSVDQNWYNANSTTGSPATEVTHDYTSYSFWGVLRPPYSN